jgi:ribosomal protein S7
MLVKMLQRSCLSRPGFFFRMQKFILRKKRKQDIIFNSLWVLKFLNYLTKEGKKFSYEKKFNLLVLDFKKKKSLVFRFQFFEVLEKIKPSIRLRSIVRGKNNHHIPILLKVSKQYQASIKIIEALFKKHKNMQFFNKVSLELSQILFAKSKYKNYFESYKGDAIKSRAFSHYR